MDMQENWDEIKDGYYKKMRTFLLKPNYEEAYRIINEGYLFLKSNLGENDSRTLDLMHLTASRLKDLGKLSESIDLLHDCLELRLKNERKIHSFYGISDLNTIRCANAYIVFKGEQEGNIWAKEAYGKLYDFQNSILKSLKGNESQVKKYIEENNLSSKSVSNEVHSFLDLTMMILFNYANRLSYIGDRYYALCWMEKCYNDSLKYLGKNNIFTLRAEHNMIDRYVNVGDRKQALTHALKCYGDRYETLIKKGFPLKHLYSTKIVIYELLAYFSYHSIILDDSILEKLYNSALFSKTFIKKCYSNINDEKIIDELILKVESLIHDFEIFGEKKTYEELHFNCILAILYSYKKDSNFIKIANQVIDTLEHDSAYSLSNVDSIKLCVCIAKNIEYDKNVKYSGFNGLQLAEKAYKITEKHLGKSHGATILCLYRIAEMNVDNTEKYLQYISMFFDRLPDFVSDALLVTNKNNMVQSTDFVSECFNRYIDFLFNNPSVIKNNCEYIDYLLKYKNLIYDIDLFQSFYEDTNKKKYVEFLDYVTLNKVQSILSDYDCVLDLFQLANDSQIGVVIITKDHFDLIVIYKNQYGIKLLNEHELLKENIYVCLDNELDLNESNNFLSLLYKLDGKVSFLSLVKNLLNYNKKEKSMSSDEISIEVFSDPECSIDDNTKTLNHRGIDNSTISQYNREISNRNEVETYFPDLPFAFLEGIEIKKIFDKNCILRTRREANCFNFLQNTQSDVLHIATHAGFSKNSSLEPLERAKIILSGYTNSTKYGQYLTSYDKGFVNAKDILQMDLQNTSVVVLSGCKTGIGKYYMFQGDYGFKRAFEISGVQTIIATVGNVLDSVASYFMFNLYENFKTSNSLFDSFVFAQQKAKELTPKLFKEWVDSQKQILDEICEDTILKKRYEDKLQEVEENIDVFDCNKDSEDYALEWEEDIKNEWKKFIYIGKRI